MKIGIIVFSKTNNTFSVADELKSALVKNVWMLKFSESFRKMMIPALNHRLYLPANRM